MQRKFIAIGLVVVLVAAAAAAIFLSQPHSVASTTQTMSGYGLAVLQVESDNLSAPQGAVYYVARLNASFNGQGTWKFNPGYIEATGSDGIVYGARVSPNFSGPLASADLSPGRSVGGRVYFQMPAGVKPTALSYSDPSGPTTTPAAVSQISDSASQLAQFGDLTVKGTGLFTASVTGDVYVYNNTHIFFPGDVVQLDVSLRYYRLPEDPLNISVTSLTVSNGFTGTGTLPNLPVQIVGRPTEVGIMFLVVVPQGGFNGPVHVQCFLTG